jgi:hypothetical protein
VKIVIDRKNFVISHILYGEEKRKLGREKNGHRLRMTKFTKYSANIIHNGKF